MSIHAELRNIHSRTVGLLGKIEDIKSRPETDNDTISARWTEREVLLPILGSVERLMEIFEVGTTHG